MEVVEHSSQAQRTLCIEAESRDCEWREVAWLGEGGSLRVLDGDTWYQANMLPLPPLPNELLPRIVE